MKNITKELKRVAEQLERLSQRTEHMITVAGNTVSSVGSKPKRPVSATPTDQILILMKRFKKGISVTSLREKSGLSEKQISNIVHRACKKGAIKRIRRGVYSLYGKNSEKSSVLSEEADFC